MFRAIRWIMVGVFVSSIVVQYNDPDGALWVLVYAYAAILTAESLENRYTYWAVVGFLGYFAGFLRLMPHELGPWLEIETARESGGLLMAALWMAVLSYMWIKTRKGVENTETRKAEGPAE